MAIQHNFIPPSELIINPDGSVYHLNLRPEQLAETVVTVGDPDRVSEVSKYFDEIEYKINKREFVTHTGSFKGRRISVVSTGIGTDNIDIVFNELDALANIDFSTRQIKQKLTSLRIIRIGTSGCLQGNIPLNSFLVSRFGIGLDSLAKFYGYKHPKKEAGIKQKFTQLVKSKGRFSFETYITQANQALADKIGEGWLQGITLTCPGFYAPQGRQLRLESKMNALLPTLQDFRDDYSITNFEMETAGIYLMANLLGHQAVSCNLIVANRITQQFSDNYHEAMQQLIQTVLARLV